MKTRSVRLYDIAECNLYNKEINSRFKIPNIQRGLVWKSMQMELLWDSILRGFPIGSMLVLDKEGNGGGDILDGQQRANAIITGFNKDEILGEKKPTNILWLDLNYKGSESDKERRKFGIRLTNASHPWGYDGNGNKLSANDRRDSLRKAYGEDYSQRKKSDWDIRRFVPHFFSKQTDFLPIPLAILVNAAKDKGISSPDSINEFKKTVVSDIKEFSKYSVQWKELYEDKVLEFIDKANEEFLRPLFELNNYSIVFNFVDNNDDIEILFNRVNSRGTQMTNAELAYAAIKHYGAELCDCPNIGQIIKEKSIGFMLEHNLAQLLFRYCFSDNNKIFGEINAGKIREKALLEETEKNRDKVIINLRKLFSGNARNLDIIVKRTKELLLTSPDVDCGLPNFLLAEIATKNPNLIILLFCIIEKQNHLKDRFVQALVFYLYCFSVNNEPVRLIYEKVSGDDYIKEETIVDIIRDSISREWCYPIISSFRDFPALKEAELSDSWNIEKYSDTEGFSAFKLLFTYGTYQGLFMLKYTQRRFYKEVFGDYNPSNKEHWDEINRPWDHDHIIPQNWISNGIWNNCQKAWINSIGNIADIPYEENRSKSDEANFDYYNRYDDYDMLYYDRETQSINRQSFEQGSGSVQFLRITKERFINISSEFLGLFDILKLRDNLSPMQQERKKYLTYLQKELLIDYKFYYRGSNGKEIRANELDTNFWQKPWISLIKDCGEKWCHAISIYEMREHGTTSFKLERGERNLSMDSASDFWWKEGTYFSRELPLFDNENVSFAAIRFVDGAQYYNSLKKIKEGFETDSSSFISFNITVDNVSIKAIIYTYYSYCYCSIRSITEKVKLPSKVLAYFNEEKGFRWRNNDLSIDCLLSRKDAGVEENCNAFADIMVELYNLKEEIKE